MIVSGTGSCCFGRAPDGRTTRVGGWGHVLGDRGSGYDIALRALRAVIHAGDRAGRWPPLGARLLRALSLHEPEDLVAWIQVARKNDVAALAREVFRAADDGDRIAAGILDAAAESLADDAAACARKVTRPGSHVQFVLGGSVLLKQPRFAARVARAVRRHWPDAAVTPLEGDSAWGAVKLARQAASTAPSSPAGSPRRPGRR
jgi:N-acetylglucosamine kinase-like BadF-type ATPase